MTDDGTVLPASVQIDAWSGKRAVSPLAPDARRWGAKPGLPTQKPLKFDKPPDPTDWESDEVGYGILVPDSPTAPDTGEYVWTKEKATGSALPEPVRGGSMDSLCDLSRFPRGLNFLTISLV